MPSSVTLKALGLNTSPNAIEAPPGSLLVAKNVIIRRDDVVESRRGFKLYGNSFGTDSDRLKQLLTYKNRILRHYADKLQYQDGDLFYNFSGSFTEAEEGLRIKFQEANGNLYFTTSEGIKKISAASADDFTSDSGYITGAGGVSALDTSYKLNINLGDSSGFLPSNSTVSYRIVWGIKDANGNLILGAPSPLVEVFNYLSTTLVKDFNNLTSALDQLASDSMIQYGQFSTTYGLAYNATASQVSAGLVSVAAEIDNSILLAEETVTTAPLTIQSASISDNIASITFTTSNAADYFVAGGNIYTQNFLLSDETKNIASHPTGFNRATSRVVFTTAHGFQDGDEIKFVVGGSPGSLPDPLVESSPYYIVNASSLDFQVSTTPGGDPVVFTTDGNSDNCSVVVATQGSINGKQVISTVIGDTITYPVNARGSVTITGAKINSYEYRSIIETPVDEDLNNFTIDTPTPTSQLNIIQDKIQKIYDRLSIELPDIIPTYLQTSVVSPLAITESATVDLEFTVPSSVTSDYFYQIYRSAVVEATGVSALEDLSPGDELRLVYEAYPTTQQITDRLIKITDVVPDSFRVNGANLYTNAATGDGSLQANEEPPYAKDLKLFKGTLFFANTKTKHTTILSLLGTSRFFDDVALGITPTLTIANGTVSNTYKFIKGIKQSTTVQVTASGSSINGKSFLMYSANDLAKYHVFYNTGLASSVVGTTATITTPSAHGLSNGDTVALFATDNGIDGSYVISNITPTTFDITVPLSTSSGTKGRWNKTFGDDNVIRVDILDGDSASTIASKTLNTLKNYADVFTASVATDTLTITNVDFGYTTATTGDAVFNITTVSVGQGESAANREVLLSDNISPAQNISETSQSLVRVVNRNNNECVVASYLSTSSQTPGTMVFRAKTLADAHIYFLTNDSNIGSSFNPALSPSITGITCSAASPTVVSAAGHGMVNGAKVVITGSDSTPSIDGLYTISNVTTNTFTIPVAVTVGATKGSIQKATLTTSTTNDTSPNRIYYSKYQQPDAVPLLNWVEVGAKDKKILRIFPLRDSLFIFKEDGLFRLSGETSPWVVSLFDSSCIVVAPDSVSISNNLIYGWTTQGIVTATEGGVSIMSRNIDVDIIPKASSNYPNFSTATWGTGYDSDNSYIVFTTDKTTDTWATIGYRYSNLTNTWTVIDKATLCGIVNPGDDKLYLAPADTNFIEQERKTFTRLDYADRELSSAISANSTIQNGSVLKLPNVLGINVGDVVLQEQTLSVFIFNSLLQKLDVDHGINNPTYLSSLRAVYGDNMRVKLFDLAAKLDADISPVDTYSSLIASLSGSITSNSNSPQTVITSPNHGLVSGRQVIISGVSGSVPDISGQHTVTRIDNNSFSIPVNVITGGTGGSFTTLDSSFEDIKACYNAIISKLITDPGVSYANYQPISSNTNLEAVVLAVDSVKKEVTLNTALDFIVGPITIYKSISTELVYAPSSMGDPLSLKHFREATAMFASKAFTKAIIGFSTDLAPAYIEVSFNGDGNGIFGNTAFGTGYFGGGSNSAPLRTYIPRNAQRCRYMNIKFSHHIAREKWSLYGITLTGEITSTRGYR